MKLLDQNRNYRIKLLPYWFKILLTIQLFLVLVVAYFLLFEEVSPNFRIRCFGFQSFGFNSMASYILSLFLIVTCASSTAILSGSKMALKLAKTTYLFALATSVIAVFLLFLFPKNSALYVPVESLLFVGMYYYIKKIEYRWQFSFVKN